MILLFSNRFVRKINTFRHSSRADKLLFLETVVTSAFVRFALSFLPFKKVREWLGSSNPVSIPHDPDVDLLTIQKVKTAIHLCNRYTFWKTECYTQSLTAKILLRRRNIDSILFIGFQKDENGKYKGHAWLKVHEIFVTGFLSNLEDYQVNASFS